MKRWRILSIGNTGLFLQPAVFPFALYALLLGYGRLWASSILSILLHETAHALTAAAFKCAPSAVEITPLGAVMLLEDDMKLPLLKRAAMLFAGPAASLMLAGLSVWLTNTGCLNLSLARSFFLCNIAIVTINLLPVLPLDGGRLLHLLLSHVISPRFASKFVRLLGFLTGFALIILNIAVSVKYGGWNLSLAVAGCSILYSTTIAMMTNKLQELRFFMDRKIALERRGYQPCKLLCVMGNTPLRRILSALPGNRQVFCVVFESGSMSMLGVINETQMIQSYLDKSGITLADALTLSEKAAKTTKNDTI